MHMRCFLLVSVNGGNFLSIACFSCCCCSIVMAMFINLELEMNCIEMNSVVMIHKNVMCVLLLVIVLWHSGCGIVCRRRPAAIS